MPGPNGIGPIWRFWGRPRIDVANKNLDQIYKELKPQLDEKPGETCFARYDKKKGLRIKDGISNERGNTDVRGKKFSNAAEVFKRGIDNQYPGEMVGDLTLGEAMVQSVIGDCANGVRISAPQIQRLYEKTHEYAAENGLDPVMYEHDPVVSEDGVEDSGAHLEHQSSAVESRFVQSWWSIEAGRRYLRNGVYATLAQDPKYAPIDELLKAKKGSYEWRKAAYLIERLNSETDGLMTRVDVSKGISMCAFEDIESLLENHRPPMALGRELLHLRNIVEMRDKIEAANHEFVRLNKGLNAMMGHFEADIQLDLEKAIVERRKMLNELRHLKYPTGFGNPNEWLGFADRLQSNAAKFTRLLNDLNRSMSPHRLEAYSNLKQQLTETLALAEILRFDAGDENAAASQWSINNADNDLWLSLKDLYNPEVLSGSKNALQGARSDVPKILWEAPTRYGKTSLQSLGAAYDGLLEESQDLVKRYHGTQTDDDLREAVRGVREALAANDKMLDTSKSVRAIRGDGALSGPDAKNSLLTLQQQRHHLNLQLVCLRALQREALPPPQNNTGLANAVQDQHDGNVLDDSLAGAASAHADNVDVDVAGNPDAREQNDLDRNPVAGIEPDDLDETISSRRGSVWSSLHDSLSSSTRHSSLTNGSERDRDHDQAQGNAGGIPEDSGWLNDALKVRADWMEEDTNEASVIVHSKEDTYGDTLSVSSHSETYDDFENDEDAQRENSRKIAEKSNLS